MNKMSCGVLLGTLFVAIGSFMEAEAETVVEVMFMKYSANCDEDMHTTYCDPYFTLCLDRPRDTTAITPCYYGSTGRSGYFTDVNNIDFSTMTDIKGIKNPWSVRVPVLKDRSMTFVVEVRDRDTFKDDPMVEWNRVLPITVYSTQRVAVWSTIEFVKNDYVLSLEYRAYCAANYVGADCSILGA